MITIKPFDINVVKTHKGFFRLGAVDNETEIQILHNTPAGYIETDIADAFRMSDGVVVVAWKAHMPVTPMHNLVAVVGSKTKVINLTPLERIIDIYDNPVDAQFGTFIFTNSDMILAPKLDWRCDSGQFGPFPFSNQDNVLDGEDGVIEGPSKMVVYEPIISVNGCGHIIYIEGEGKQDLANLYLNNAEVPVTTRTLWESLKLVREWAIVNQEPFNNAEAVSLKARLFMDELGFSSHELSTIDSQVHMQVANYLLGNTNARNRPDGVFSITNDVKHILFNRLASGSVSALEYLNPGMWNLQELLQAEKEQIVIDRFLFENIKKDMDPNKPAIAIQNRFFANKQLILDKIENNAL